MEVEFVGIDFPWNSSIRYSSSWFTQIKKSKTKENDLCLSNHTTSGFVGFEFCCLSSPPGFAGSWVCRMLCHLGLLVCGFTAGFMGSLLGSPTEFVVSIFSDLISCFQCFV